MLNIRISKLSKHWSRKWLVACSVPSPYLNQCWLIVNGTLGNKPQGNLNQNKNLFIHENAFKNVVCEMVAILSRGRWVKDKSTRIVGSVMAARVRCPINSSSPSAAYTRQWTESALVQVMACCLFGAKPLPETMQTYCQLDPSLGTNFSYFFFIEILTFSFKKMHLKMLCAKWQPFCRGRDGLKSRS